MAPNVVAIIPALDEAGSIGATVAELPRSLVARVIVVDNGSSDDTAAVASRAGATVVTERRRGYGFACMAGVAAASDADVYLFLDGDGSDMAAQADRILGPLLNGRADLVLGSRRGGEVEPGSLTPQARFGNRLASILLRMLEGQRVADLSPFKAVRADRLAELGLEERTYGWTIELIVRAMQRRLRIVEVTVGYRRRRTGESKVSGTLPGTVRASLRILITIARLHVPSLSRLQLGHKVPETVSRRDGRDQG